MPELDGPMYTSTGRSPGLNGWLFVQIPRERSSREIVRMWTSQDAPVRHVVAGTSGPLTAPRAPVAPLGRQPTLRRMAFRHPGCRKRGGRHHPQMADLQDKGRVAQWESARFTRERSQVRNPPRPLETPGFGVTPVPIGAKTPPSAKAFSRAGAPLRHGDAPPRLAAAACDGPPHRSVIEGGRP
jgi:hypothetical protein